MDTIPLEKIGLTKNEIKVYLALLELGESTTSLIISKSGLHSSRVYESLTSLTRKGMVSSVTKSKRKYFSASEPDNILDILEQEKADVSHLLPELKAIKPLKPQEEKSVIFEGYKGVRYVYDSVVRTLGKGDEILVFGARGADESFMSETYFKEYTRRRVKKGIKMKILFNEDAKETGKFYAKLENTSVRYLPKGMKTPAAVDIFGNNVATLVLKPKPVVFLITSREVSDSYREFFSMLWKMAE